MKFTEKTVIWIYTLIFAVIIVAASFSYKNSTYTAYKEKIRHLGAQLVQSIPNPSHAPLVKTPLISPAPLYHEPTEQQKTYLLAMGAILSATNHENTTTLKSNLEITSLKALLTDSWNIADRTSALAALEWLKNIGHRTEYDDLQRILLTENITSCAQLESKGYNFNTPDITCSDTNIQLIRSFLITLKGKLNGKTLYAWDYGRMINLSRWCYTAGYISEKEAWQYILPAGIKLQSYYGSWREYGDQYLLGRAYWLKDIYGSADQTVILKALTNPSSKSAWTTIDWKTDLK